MKTYILIAFLMITAISWSQRSEKIRAYKTAYITEHVDLTSAEAEKFWPIYNKFQDQLFEIRRKERKDIFDTVKGDLDALSEEEAKTLLASMRELKLKEHQYHVELMSELVSILPAKKILKLKRAEEEFKRSLLRRYKNRRGGGP